MRYYDMPPGSDFCFPYEKMMEQAARGRTCALVPVSTPAGGKGVYIFSGMPEREITKDNTYQHCLQMVMGARNAAQRDSFVVLPPA